MDKLHYEVREYINGRTDWNLIAAFADYSAAEEYATSINRDPDGYITVEVERV